MVEMFSGILTGMGYGNDPADFKARHGLEHRHNDGCFIAVFNVKAFRNLEGFKRDVDGFVDFVKTSPASSDIGVQYPVSKARIIVISIGSSCKENIISIDAISRGIAAGGIPGNIQSITFRYNRNRNPSYLSW